MSIDSQRPFRYLLICALGCFLSLMGCEEEYLQQPPFSQVQDTIFHDVDNWFYFNPAPIMEGEVPFYPFAYDIFDSEFEGFLTKTSDRIYMVDREKDIANKQVLLDLNAQEGDTLFRYSRFQYSLLIDRRKNDALDEEFFYVLRRSRTGVKRLRERTLWLISEKRGILAAGKYDIGFSDGQVELDLIGDSRYFTHPELIRKIKYYDHDATWLVDRDSDVIYEFDKYTGVLKSRDFNKRTDLYTFNFDQKKTRHWVDFQIRQNNQSQTILLQTGDSCYYFTESLKLQRSGLCQ